MSYSFNVQAPTKAEAKAAIEAEFDKVLTNQPVHEADLPAARIAVLAFVDVLSEPTDGEEVKASVNGYVSWRGEGDFVSAKVNIAAIVTAKAVV